MKLFPAQAIYNWYRQVIRNPKYRWWIIIGSLIYFVSPIDISPDLLPIVGQVDDMVIVTLLVAEVSQMLLDYAKGLKGDKTSTAEAESAEPAVDINAVEVNS
jgi:uncharacterized membrane protein YkvA (DUF1232 family)